MHDFSYLDLVVDASLTSSAYSSTSSQVYSKSKFVCLKFSNFWKLHIPVKGVTATPTYSYSTPTSKSAAVTNANFVLYTPVGVFSSGKFSSPSYTPPGHASLHKNT